MKIFKYTLAIKDEQTILMPKGATVLTAEVQDNVCCVWVECDETAELSPRTFAMHGTGYTVTSKPKKYINTVLLYQDSLVFHIFEVLQ